MNKLNISVLVLGIVFIMVLIVKMMLNYSLKKKVSSKSKKEILNTKDFISILFNAGAITGGVIIVIQSFGYGSIFFGNDLTFPQPIINFLAGIIFIWFAIRNIFYDGGV